MVEEIFKEYYLEPLRHTETSKMVDEIFKNHKIIGSKNDILRYITVHKTEISDVDLNFFRNKTIVVFLIISHPSAHIMTLTEEYSITKERLMAAESLLSIINAKF